MVGDRSPHPPPHSPPWRRRESTQRRNASFATHGEWGAFVEQPSTVGAIPRASRASPSALIAGPAPDPSIYSILPEQSTTSHPAATTPARGCRNRRQRFHPDVVAHQQTVEADAAADDLADHRRRTGSPAGSGPSRRRRRAQHSIGAHDNLSDGSRSVFSSSALAGTPAVPSLSTRPAVPRMCR